jgi:hypothetical protein
MLALTRDLMTLGGLNVLDILIRRTWLTYTLLILLLCTWG